MNILERLERHVPRMADGECWEMTYQSRTISPENNVGNSIPAARVAWEAHHAQPIPDGMVVCHTCDNPRCVNPEHLFLGSYSDNMVDCVSKGRHVGKQPTSREKIDLARKLLGDGKSSKEICAEVHIGNQTLTKIRNNEL